MLRNGQANQKERVESRRISASGRKPPGVARDNSPSPKKRTLLEVHQLMSLNFFFIECCPMTMSYILMMMMNGHDGPYKAPTKEERRRRLRLRGEGNQIKYMDLRFEDGTL